MNLLDVVLLNDGLKLTFNNDRGTSFVSRVLVTYANRKVQEDVTLSDHTLITFSITTTRPKPRQQKSTLGQAWNIRKLDNDILAYQIDIMETSTGDTETMVIGLMDMLKATCDAAMPRKKSAKRNPPGGVPLFASFGRNASKQGDKRSAPEGNHIMPYAWRPTEQSRVQKRHI